MKRVICVILSVLTVFGLTCCQKPRDGKESYVEFETHTPAADKEDEKAEAETKPEVSAEPEASVEPEAVTEPETASDEDTAANEGVLFENTTFIKKWYLPNGNASVIAYRPDDPDTYFKIYCDGSILANELDSFSVSLYFIECEETLITSKGEIQLSYESTSPMSADQLS